MLLRLSTGERPLGSWRAWWGKEEEESGVPLLRSRLGETGSDLMLMLGLVLTVKVAAEMEAAACGRRLPCLAEKGEGGEGARKAGPDSEMASFPSTGNRAFGKNVRRWSCDCGKGQPATNRGQLPSAQNAVVCGGRGGHSELGVYYNFEQLLSDWP